MSGWRGREGHRGTTDATTQLCSSSGSSDRRSIRSSTSRSACSFRNGQNDRRAKRQADRRTETVRPRGVPWLTKPVEGRFIATQPVSPRQHVNGRQRESGGERTAARFRLQAVGTGQEAGKASTGELRRRPDEDARVRAVDFDAASLYLPFGKAVDEQPRSVTVSVPGKQP